MIDNSFRKQSMPTKRWN